MNVTVNQDEAKKIEAFMRRASEAGYTEDEIKSAIQQKYGRKPAPVDPKQFDPTEGMSTTEKLLAGVGKAFVDVGRGVGQLTGDVAEGVGFNRPSWAPTDADISRARELDAPLMKTGAGMTGNVLGNIATFAPLALVPGANTIAGGAALGAATGATIPVAEGESRGGNAAFGGVSGAVVPAAIRSKRVVQAALIDPFTQKGNQRIVGGALNRVAADRQAAIASMLANKGKTPGFNPTAGQASGDAGIASLERAASAIDPGGFQAVKDSQTSALVDALRGVAKTPEARQAAITAREQATEALYSQAKNAVIPDDGSLASLLQRPSMKAAQAKAAKLAQERNGAFNLPQAKPANVVQTGVLDASGNPITKTLPAQPAEYTGQLLHDLKIGLDDAIGVPGQGGFQGAERRAAIGTKDEFLNWMERNIPEYGQARTTYADMSKPINQMDIGQELYKRFVPALADDGAVPFRSRASAYAEALRNGDVLARNVTGMKNATLDGVMTPEQLAALRGVADDASMVARAQDAGRGVGSDTVQKLAMSNVMAQAGIPNWMQGLGRVPGGWLRTLGDIVYTKNDDAIRDALAQIIKDPVQAAEAMQMAKTDPAGFVKMLQTVSQGAALSLPSAVNASEQ